MTVGRTRFGALDAWRGIAASGVAAFHFGVVSHFFDLSLIRNAAPYVDFFFVLSGFVISHTYGERINSVADAGLFMLRRFGRLWPLHVFTLLCLVALEVAKAALLLGTGLSAGEAPFTGSASGFAIPAHLIFLQAVGLFPNFTWNDPSWSIGCEFWTYLLFACGCLAGIASRRLSILFVLLAVAVLGTWNAGTLDATYDLGLFRCMAGFFSGVLTYQLFSKWKQPIANPTLYEWIVVAIAAACIAGYAKLHALNPFLSFLPLVIFPLVIFVFAHESGRVSAWLLNEPVQALGRWSYSIYMVHFVILTVMNSGLRVLDRLLGTQIETKGGMANEPNFIVPLWLGDLMFLVYFALVVIMAAMTWRYVEEPCRIYFNGLARRRTLSRAPALSP